LAETPILLREIFTVFPEFFEANAGRVRGKAQDPSKLESGDTNTNALVQSS
jgi:hypothetical protein